jgi:hypothetical protein
VIWAITGSPEEKRQLDVVGPKLPRPPRDLNHQGTKRPLYVVYVKFHIKHGRRTAMNIISKASSRVTTAAYNVECTFC